MGRLHSHRHGKSHSVRPAEPAAPAWEAPSGPELEGLIVGYARDGMTPSQIGVRLRDRHAVPLARPVLGRRVAAVLAGAGAAPEMPEDLESMVRKAVGLQRHLREHRADRRNVRSLELIEAKIHRLTVYYKRAGRIPAGWKYKSVVAQLE